MLKESAFYGIITRRWKKSLIFMLASERRRVAYFFNFIPRNNFVQAVRILHTAFIMMLFIKNFIS